MTVPGPSQRYRCFKVADHHAGEDPIRLERLVLGLKAHTSLTEWAWIMHDRDEGRPHVHVAIRCRNARTREEVARYLGVSVEVVWPLSGRGAFARYLRYLTHEAPDQAHQARYRDDEVHANFDWRAVVNGLPVGAAQKGPAVEELVQQLFRGEVTIKEVYDRHPDMAVKHWSRLSRAEAQGAEFLHRVAMQERREGEAEQLRANEEARKLAEEKARQEAEELARQEADEQARKLAEEKARRMEWLASQEYRKQQEHKAAQEVQKRQEEHFRDLLDMTAQAYGFTGHRDAREAQVTQEAVEAGLLAQGAVLTLDVLAAAYCAAHDIEPDIEEVNAELARFQQEVRHMPTAIAAAEHHAADGNSEAFATALRLRRECVEMPDIYRVPAVRSDLRKDWQEQLTAVC